MGLLDSTNQNSYYTTAANYGNYQFTTLENIINAFMVAYVGESKIITKINRTDVQFYAMRAIQELSYDVFRSVKSQEIEIPSTLVMILPQDYVNYVKLVRVDSNGIERILYPTGKTSNPFAITQDGDGIYQYTNAQLGGAEEDLTEQSPSNTWSNYQSQTSNQNIYSDDSTDIDIVTQVKDKIKDGIDLLFIDGNHEPDGLLADFNNYKDLVNSGGFIVFDDYGFLPDVKNTVDDIDFSGFEVIGEIDMHSGNTPGTPGKNASYIVYKK